MIMINLSKIASSGFHTSALFKLVELFICSISSWLLPSGISSGFSSASLAVSSEVFGKRSSSSCFSSNAAIGLARLAMMTAEVALTR
jgi:hypothetical protein